MIPRFRDISEQQADARSVMTGRVVDSYTNITTVKLFSHAGREAVYAKEGMMAFLQTVYRQMRLSTVLDWIVDTNNNLLVLFTGALGIWLWSSGQVSLGAIATALALSMRLNGMSQWIMWETTALFENIGVVHDGITTISQSLSVRDRDDATELKVEQGRIHYDEVSFHYGKTSGVVSDLSLDIRPGEKIGLVGRSGAGKTTLVNLLLRFYDPEAGRVYIDGQDISTVTQDSLRAQIGMVTQDTSLLHRSIRENIAYGKPECSDAEIIAAAKKARAWDFIQDLEDRQGRRGLDCHVGERGVKLSGGQRQRVAIARVFLKDAPILVLD